MGQKDHNKGDPAPHQALRNALDRITQSETIPPLEAFLDLGRELREARLDYFIEGAFPDRTDPARYARPMVDAACRYHALSGEQVRLGDDHHVIRLLAEIAQRQPSPYWPYVRDELAKFPNLVVAELKKMDPPNTGGQLKDYRTVRTLLSADLEALRAYELTLRNFISCIGEAATAFDESRRRPELVERREKLLATLSERRPVTLIAGVNSGCARERMTDLLELSYKNCEIIQLSSDGIVSRSMLANLNSGVGRYLRELQDLIALGEEQLRKNNARASAPKKTRKTPTQTKRSVVRPVELHGRGEPPIVRGKRKESPLTKGQYDVVGLLLTAGENGLTKDDLVTNSSHADARGILRRLADSDSDWRAVIKFPGKPWGRYRIG